MADITTKAPAHRAKILGFQSTVINLAYALGPAAGGVLCDLYGARASFFIVGGAAMVTSAGFSFLPETLKKAQDKEREREEGGGEEGGEGRRGDGSSSGGGSSGDEVAAMPTAWEVYRPLLLNPDQQGVMSMNFAVFSSYSALMTVFPLHAAEVMGSEGGASAIGALFASGAVVGFLGAPLGGYLADKIGRKNTVVPAACLIAVGAISTTSGAIDSFYTMLPAVMIWGVGNSMCNPGLAAFAADIAKDEQTRGQVGGLPPSLPPSPCPSLPPSLSLSLSLSLYQASI